MSKKLLIVITGLPCTGKTTFGRKIAERFKLPFISKDEFKELLFDNLGWDDREYSKKIGGASYDLLYRVAGIFMEAEKSLIIETNFNPEFANKEISGLLKKYNFKVLQIRFFSDGEKLIERFVRRSNNSERHPGHVDSGNLDEFRSMLIQGKIGKMEIGGEFIDIDTTDFEKVDFETICVAVEKVMKE